MTREVLSLPIASIGELPDADYVGLIDDEAIASLMVRMDAEGLLTPIWVRRNGNAAKTPWSVIAGRHRLRAAIRLGWEAIDVDVRADAARSNVELRRLQIVENLDRRDLRPIECSRFVMERWTEAAERIGPAIAYSPQEQAVRARWDALATASNTPQTDRRLVDESTAADCGRSSRWVRIQRRVYEQLVAPFPDLFAALNAHELGKSQSAMNRLATLVHEADRRHAINTVLSNPAWETIDQALKAAGIGGDRGFRVDPNRPDVVTLTGWSKLKGVAKRSTFFTIVKDVPPAWLEEAFAADPRIARNDRRRGGERRA